jgi:hypothetical protein
MSIEKDRTWHIMSSYANRNRVSFQKFCFFFLLSATQKANAIMGKSGIISLGRFI